MRPLRTLLALVLVATTLSGCAAIEPVTSESSARGNTTALRVVASVGVWANIAQAIGGKWVAADAIITQANQDPHSYEATVRDQLKVNQADLTITNGADYDSFFARLVARKPHRKPGSDLVLATHIDQHTPNPNPHLWYDLAYVSELARVIGKAEERAVSSKSAAAEIAARTTRFENQVNDLIQQQRLLMKKVVGRGVIVTEGFVLRMVRNLALVDVTPMDFRNAVEQDQDASPATMRLMKNLMSHGQVRVLILNLQTQGAQTNQLAAWARSHRVSILKLSELLPQRTSYLQWMKSNLNQLAKALR